MNEIIHVCSFCRRFESCDVEEIKRHESYCKKNSCDECSREFKSPEELRQHFEATKARIREDDDLRENGLINNMYIDLDAYDFHWCMYHYGKDGEP